MVKVLIVLILAVSAFYLSVDKEIVEKMLQLIWQDRYRIVGILFTIYIFLWFLVKKIRSL